MISITQRPSRREPSQRGWPPGRRLHLRHRPSTRDRHTLERISRYTLLVDFVCGVTADVALELGRIFAAMGPGVRRTLTWDQGYELAAHGTFIEVSGIPVFFCNPRHPWQRPTNENTNGLLRQYFPKKTSIAHVTAAGLDHAESRLNTRPRQTLDWLTPTQRLAQLRPSTT